jgi:hypothetical protein
MTMIEERVQDAGAEPEAARALVAELAEAGLLDRVMKGAESGELTLTGEGGFLPEMVKAVLERGLAAELTGHLGYDKGDPAGRGSRITDVRARRCDCVTWAGFPALAAGRACCLRCRCSAAPGPAIPAATRPPP